VPGSSKKQLHEQQLIDQRILLYINDYEHQTDHESKKFSTTPKEYIEVFEGVLLKAINI
jgi:hypothetical protein